MQWQKLRKGLANALAAYETKTKALGFPGGKTTGNPSGLMLSWNGSFRRMQDMSGDTIKNRRDILLLLLYSPGCEESPNEPISGRTRLVKMLFLFKQEVLEHFKRGTEIDEDNFYEFFPWDFGPFSRQVYDDLTFFTLRGFIKAELSTEDTLPESAAEWEMWLTSSTSYSERDEITDYNEQSFRLADRGITFASGLYASLSKAQQRQLREFKKRLSQAPLRAILKYVYESYPEQTTRSQIRGQVLGSG